MKFLFFFLLLIPLAHGWEIKKVGEEMQLTDPSLKNPVKVITAFESKDLPTEKVSSVVIVRYLENIGGTKSIAKNYNCAAFVKGKLLFKDETCLVEGETPRKAEFKVVNNKLHYKFEEVEEEYSLE